MSIMPMSKVSREENHYYIIYIYINYHINHVHVQLSQLFCSKVYAVGRWMCSSQVLNWEAAKLLGFDGASDPRLATAAKASRYEKNSHVKEK